MNPPPQNTELLGSIIHDIWASGTPAQALGKFVCLQLGSEHPYLTHEAFGLVLSNLALANAGRQQLGKFALLQMQGSALSSQEAVQNEPPNSPIQPIAIKTVVADLLKNEFKIRTTKPSRTTKKVRVIIDGRDTSLSINKDIVDSYISIFGAKSLSKLANSVCSINDATGIPRSTRVQREIEKALAEHNQKSVTQVMGLTVYQGGRG